MQGDETEDLLSSVLFFSDSKIRQSMKFLLLQNPYGNEMTVNRHPEEETFTTSKSKQLPSSLIKAHLGQ